MPVFIEVNDVVSYWRGGCWHFSIVVQVPDIGDIVVMPSDAKQPLTLKREDVKGVYREVLE